MGIKENHLFESKQYLDMAEETYLEYKILRDEKMERGAMNRLYFSAYQAVYPLLISIGETLKTHKGVADRFYQHFISTDKIPRKINTGYSKLIMFRGWSDYEFSKSATQEDLDEGEKILNFLLQFTKKWIKQLE